MGKFNSNKVIRGTFGRAWVDGDLMANVKSFEAKATIDYEDLDINGDFGQKKAVYGVFHRRDHDAAQIRQLHPEKIPGRDYERGPAGDENCRFPGRPPE